MYSHPVSNFQLPFDQAIPARAAVRPTATLGTAQKDSPQEAKLRQAGKDFEAILIDSLWSSMKKGSLGGDENQDDPISDSLTGLGMEMASRAIANAGGLGIGNMIVKNLEAKISQSESGDHPAMHSLTPLTK
jgi:Rod binding domain-containing protein